MQQQMSVAMPPGGGAIALEEAPRPRRCGGMSHRRLAPVVGLVVAVGLMVLSLSAFVVGSNAVGSATGILVGQQAVNFSARDADGRRRTLHEFRDRPVLLVFGSALDHGIDELSDAPLPDGTHVLLLTADRLPDKALQEEAGDVLPLHDERRRVAEQYGVWSGVEVSGVATAQGVLIDRSGAIVDRGPLVEILHQSRVRATR